MESKDSLFYFVCCACCFVLQKIMIFKNKVLLLCDREGGQKSLIFKNNLYL